MNRYALAAAAALALACGTKADAAVLYDYSDSVSGFSYTSPGLIASDLTVPATSLNRCHDASATCTGVMFSPDRNTIVYLLRLPSGRTALDPIALEPFALSTFGEHHTLTGSGTLKVTLLPGAVPEPAGWAMLIAGAGLIGAALRRTKLAGHLDPRTADEDGRSYGDRRSGACVQLISD